MILGIGIDSVEIARFAHWHTFGTKQLQRIFSLDEIDYCLRIQQKSAERFAVRFAAREACYKALNQWQSHAIPFLTFCKMVTVSKNKNGLPTLVIDWHYSNKQLAIDHCPSIRALLSLTHTKNIATACVIFEQQIQSNLI